MHVRHIIVTSVMLLLTFALFSCVETVGPGPDKALTITPEGTLPPEQISSQVFAPALPATNTPTPTPVPAISIDNIHELQAYMVLQEEHYGRVYGLAFSPDSSLLAVSMYRHPDLAISIWNLARGEKIQTLEVPPDVVYGIAFSPDGKWLATGGSNKKILLWDVETWAVAKEFTGASQAIGGLTFSPDGRLLVSGASGNEVIVWRVEDGSILHQGPFGGPGVSVSFSSDGKYYAASNEALIRVWRVEDGEEVLHLNVCASGLAFSRSGGALAYSCSSVGYEPYRPQAPIGIFNMEEGTTTLGAFAEATTRIVFSADDSLLLATSYDPPGLRAWDPLSGQLIREFAPTHIRYYGLAISPDGTTLAAGGSSGQIVLFGFHPTPLSVHYAYISTSCINPSQATLSFQVPFSPGKGYAVDIAGLTYPCYEDTRYPGRRFCTVLAAPDPRDANASLVESETGAELLSSTVLIPYCIPSIVAERTGKPTGGESDLSPDEAMCLACGGELGGWVQSGPGGEMFDCVLGGDQTKVICYQCSYDIYYGNPEGEYLEFCNDYLP